MTADNNFDVVEKHELCFVKELKPSADRTLNNYCVELARPPYLFNMLPMAVAARTDISALAKLLYADRLSHVEHARKANETARKNGSDRAFTVPFAAWPTLAKRLWCSVSAVRTAAQQLVNAGLMRVTVANNSSHRCNQFEALFYNDPAIKCFEDAIEGVKIPANGSSWKTSLLRHCYFLPVPVIETEADSPLKQLTMALADGFFGQIGFVNMLVYAFAIKTAHPCLFMGCCKISRELGLHRSTVNRSLLSLVERKLLVIGASKRRPYYAIAEHPYMIDDVGFREYEFSRLSEALNKENVDDVSIPSVA